MAIEPLLTPQEAAAELGVPVAKVWALCRAGELRALKLGGNPKGRTRIRRADLEAYQRRQAE